MTIYYLGPDKRNPTEVTSVSSEIKRDSILENVKRISQQNLLQGRQFL